MSHNAQIRLDALEEVCSLPLYRLHIMAEILEGDFLHGAHVGKNSVNPDEGERQDGESREGNEKLAADGKPREDFVEVHHRAAI